MIGKGIEKIIGQIASILPGTEILIVSPIWLGEDVWKLEYDPEFNRKSVQVSKKLKEVYKRIAEKNKSMFLAASDYAKPSNIDQEHLDAKGHEDLAKAIYNVIQKIMSNT